MEQLKVTGIVTRCAPYKDADKMLTLITREMGRMDVAARGCRNIGSRLLACSEQFCYGEFVLGKRGERYSLRQCDLIDSFFALRNDFERLFAGSGMLSAAEKLSLPGEPDEELFMWTLYFLSVICHGDVNPLDLTLCFIVKLMAHAGYRPMLSQCALCNGPVDEGAPLLDAFAGGLVCGGCVSRFSKPACALSVKAIERMLLVKPENLVNVRLPERVLKELSAFLPAYAQRKMEKSFAAFQVLFKQAETEF